MIKTKFIENPQIARKLIQEYLQTQKKYIYKPPYTKIQIMQLHANYTLNQLNQSNPKLIPFNIFNQQITIKPISEIYKQTIQNYVSYILLNTHPDPNYAIPISSSKYYFIKDTKQTQTQNIKLINHQQLTQYFTIRQAKNSQKFYIIGRKWKPCHTNRETVNIFM